MVRRRAKEPSISGAGPGDPKLLTLRGKECLEQADVVLYDYLANEALLQYVPHGRAAVRRSAWSRTTIVINRDQSRLIDQARRRKTCGPSEGWRSVCLRAGWRRAEAVAAAGLDYEVVPV